MSAGANWVGLPTARRLALLAALPLPACTLGPMADCDPATGPVVVAVAAAHAWATQWLRSTCMRGEGAAGHHQCITASTQVLNDNVLSNTCVGRLGSD